MKKHPHTDEMRKALGVAFRAIRKNGVIARQSFMCCSSCAYSMLHLQPDQRAVFYHKQDTEDLVARGYCHIRFGTGNDDSEATRALGEVAATAFRDAGLKVEWTGSPDETIVVRLPEMA